MSGRTDLVICAIVLISALAALSDLVFKKIFNWLTVPALLAGLAVSAWQGGWAGIGDGMLAVGVALALYGWMFWLGAMGGGDVKLLMALGAWGGVRYVVDVALLGFVFGGVMAVLILGFKGKLGDFTRRMQRFFLTIFVKELEIEAPKLDRRSSMPFGIPIAFAAVAVAKGVRLWK